LGPDADGDPNSASTTAIGFATFMLAVPSPAGANNAASGMSGNSMSSVFGGSGSAGAGTWSPLSSTATASFSFPTSSSAQSQAASQQQQQQMAIHQLQMQQRQQMAQQQQAMQKTLSPAAKARQSAATAGAGSNIGSIQHQQQLFQQQLRNAGHLQSPSKSNSNTDPPHLTLSRPDFNSMTTTNNNTAPSSPSTGLPPTSTSASSAAAATMTGPGGCKYLPFNFKTWENIPPVHVGGAGGNDTETSLGLALFAARRA
jgi:hypothetical protein